MSGNGVPSRGRVWLKGLFGGIGAQMVSTLIGLAFIPLALDYLGATQFGVWVILNSIMAYFGLVQGGTGIATVAMISRFSRDAKQQKSVFHDAVHFLTWTSLILMILLLLMVSYQDAWSGVFSKLASHGKEEAVWACVFLIFPYLCRFPATVFSTAFVGLQELHLERFYVSVLPTTLNFIVLLITIHFHGGLIMLAGLTGGANVVSSLAAMIHFLARHGTLIRNNRYIPSLERERKFIHSSLRFIFVSSMAVIVWNTDSLVIGYFFGQEQVTAYAVTFKIFMAGFILVMSMSQALWPMFGTEGGNENWEWINRVYGHTLILLPILGGLIWIGGILFAKPIILLWAGETGYGGSLVVFALGGYAYLISTGSVHASLLSGLNIIVLWMAILEAVLNFLLSVVLIRYFGIGGVALGTLLASLFTVCLFGPVIVKRETKGHVSMPWQPVLRFLFTVVFPFVFVAQLTSTHFTLYTEILAGIFIIFCYLYVSWKTMDKTSKNKILYFLKVNEVIA